jgi:hypothetical protein
MRHLDFWSVAAFGTDDSAGSPGPSGNDSGPSTPAPKPAAKSAAPPTFKNLTEASKAGYHGQAVNIAGKGVQKVSFGDSSYDKKMAKASASAKKPSVGTSASNKSSSIYTSPNQSGKSPVFTLPPPSSGGIKPVTAAEKAAFKKKEQEYRDLGARGVDSGFTGSTASSQPLQPMSSAESGSTGINSAYENLMNTLTPGDGKEYINGVLRPTGYVDPAVDNEFIDRFRTQNMAAAVDPYGMSTQSGAILTSGQPLSYTDRSGRTQTIAGEDRANATRMLDNAGITADQYVASVDALGQRLDEPRFGAVSGFPIFQGLDYLADLDQRRAYEQLTGTYEPSGIASALGIANSATVRYVPVMEGGQIIGSLSVDDKGTPLTYTGQRSNSAQVGDPSIDQAAAMEIIRAPVSSDVTNQSDDASGVSGESIDPGTGTADPCPEGYRMNPETNACEIDPFQRPFPTPFPTPGPLPADPGTLPVVTAPYTAATPYNLAPLTPSAQPAFVVPTPNVQPITVAQQTPAGLAGLPFRRV